MGGQDDDGFGDPPTAIDPGVPTGARDRPARFDPHARLEDNRAKVPSRDRSEPMRVISMKTPADVDFAEKERAPRVLPVVKLRAISDLHQTLPRGIGNLAPPFDPREARSRRRRDNVIWGSLAVIVASIVTLAIWFLARR